jgi:hypothetical protein
VVDALSRPGLEIDMTNCRVVGAAAAQDLERNHGPT